MWFGSVESKLRHLTMTLRRCHKVASAHIWPVAFSKPRKSGGFLSQTWYVGIKLQEGVKMDINHVLPSLRYFSAIINSSLLRFLYLPGDQAISVEVVAMISEWKSNSR